MITYVIGVISGMQDMAQVRVCFYVFNVKGKIMSRVKHVS
jgi:hypothetical protein